MGLTELTRSIMDQFISAHGNPRGSLLVVRPNGDTSRHSSLPAAARIAAKAMLDLGMACEVIGQNDFIIRAAERARA